MTVLTATFFGIYLVFLVGPMLGVVLDRRAHLARTLYMAGVLFVTLVSFGIEPLRQFFDFTMPNVALLWPGIAVVVPVALAQWWLARRAGRKFADTVEAADERIQTNHPE